MSRRSLEVESLADFDARIATARSLAGWFVQSVDLRDRGDALRTVDPQGAVFLGCPLDEATQRWLNARGALLFPALPDLPFDPYRPRLYDADELLAADDGYRGSLDARVYAWSRAHVTSRNGDLADTLAGALHDHAIGDALDGVLAEVDLGSVVGVMGGHALARDDQDFAAAARLGRALARSGRTVVTGGGPGAMEAANLGAWLAGAEDAALDAALVDLAAVPSFRPSVDAWVASALGVRQAYAPGGRTPNLGIPTWFYGHEPPNAFATGIAKYFGNALREDTLLARCRGGIVFLPGAAGTVQEVFQAANENYYAAEPTAVAPMIMVDRAFWTSVLPAWPLLRSLAADRPMSPAIHLVETVDEAAALLL